MEEGQTSSTLLYDLYDINRNIRELKRLDKIAVKNDMAYTT
jgi:hypothetical protein